MYVYHVVADNTIALVVEVGGFMSGKFWVIEHVLIVSEEFFAGISLALMWKLDLP
jgi:uncharacterized membrane protein